MPHFDYTITLGSLIWSVSSLVLAAFAWRDLTWRIKNLETWRKEHMVDADARDNLIQKMDKVLDHVRWQTDHMLGRRVAPPEQN